MTIQQTLSALAGAVLVAVAGAAADDCIGDRDALLALDQNAFDQDLDGGWRAVAARDGCRGAAADLIAEYRARMLARPVFDDAGPSASAILYWHEGQLRAGLGETDAAIGLFRASVKADDPAWNAYVAASIAFLLHDREALEAARAALLEVPEPPGFAAAAEQARAKGMEVTWPMNLNVVDRLIACFDVDYSDAYAGRCDAANTP